MRRDSGATGLRGRFAGAALALLVVVSGVVVGIAGPARLGPVGPAPAAAQSGSTSITTSMFKSLADGAAGQVGGAAAGWAMGAMGLSTGDSAALASIDADLQTIISQLNEIEQELAQLTASIQQLDCDTLTANINQARTVIDSLGATYQEFTDQAAGTFGPPSVPPIGTMTTWANTGAHRDEQRPPAGRLGPGDHQGLPAAERRPPAGCRHDR
jgi:hypothetical protein